MEAFKFFTKKADTGNLESFDNDGFLKENGPAELRVDETKVKRMRAVVNGNL